MFSGIVETVGRIEAQTDGCLMVFASPTFQFVSSGSSVCVSGVCLTVAEVDVDKNRCSFRVMAETLRKTTLGQKKTGEKVNIEGSLHLGDEVGGHFVYGHVDGVGVVMKTKEEHDARLITIKPPRELLDQIVPQGSVAIDGVSLTVAQTHEDGFMVSLVPYTKEHTTLGTLTVGDRVNIEVDMIAKYVAAQIKNLEP